MILAMRLFFILMLVLAYCEDRYLSRQVTIAFFIIGWLALYAIAKREARR